MAWALANRRYLATWFYQLNALIYREFARIAEAFTMLVIAPLSRPFLLAVAFGFSESGWLSASMVLRGLVISSCVYAAFSHSSSSLAFLKIHGGLQDIIKAPINLSQLFIALIAGGVLRGGIMLIISAGLVRLGIGSGLVRVADGAYILALFVNASIIGVIVGLFCRDYTSTKSLGDTVIQPTLLVSVALMIGSQEARSWTMLGPWSAFAPLLSLARQHDRAAIVFGQLSWFVIMTGVLMWKASRIKRDLEATI